MLNLIEQAFIHVYESSVSPGYSVIAPLHESNIKLCSSSVTRSKY